MKNFISAVQPFGVTKQHLETLEIKSIFDISRKKEKDFIKSTNGTLSAKQSSDIHKIATKIHNNVMFKALSAKTLLSADNSTQKFSTGSGSTTHFIQDKASYEDMFGSLDYYDIDDDDSIFSPAAYFVELFGLIEENVTVDGQSSTSEDAEKTPYSLKNRRPDLWNIPLDKENTETESSYLSLANEIIEQYLIKNDPSLPTITPDPKHAEQKDLADTWALKSGIPFNKPLLETIDYLDYLGVKLSDIFAVTDPEDYENMDKAALGLGFANEASDDSFSLNEILNQVFNIPDITSSEYNAEIIAKELGLKKDPENSSDLFYELYTIQEIQKTLNLPLLEVKDLWMDPDNNGTKRYKMLSDSLSISINEINVWTDTLGVGKLEKIDNPFDIQNIIQNINWGKEFNLNAYQVQYITTGVFECSTDNCHYMQDILSLTNILKSQDSNKLNNFITLISAKTGADEGIIEAILEHFPKTQKGAPYIKDIPAIFSSAFTIKCLDLSAVDVNNITNKPHSFELVTDFYWDSLDLEQLHILTNFKTVKTAYSTDPTLVISDYLVQDTGNLPHITGYNVGDIGEMYKIINPEAKYPVSRKIEGNSLTTEQVRSLGATTVGNYAIFAGGNLGNTRSDKVDIYDFSDPSDIKHIEGITLSQPRANLSATTVGNYAIFGGGIDRSSFASGAVDIFDLSTLQVTQNEDGTYSGTLTRIEENLSQPRTVLSATTVGNYAIFAGGFNNGFSDAVDIYDFSDPSDIKHIEGVILSQPRSNLSATSVGNYAIFGGGLLNQSPDTGSDAVDIFDLSTLQVTQNEDGTYSGTLTRIEENLSQSRYVLSATTVGNYAIFAGGNLGNTRSDKVDIYDFSDPSDIKHIEGITLLQPRYYLSATSVGNYAMFGGGGSSNTVDIFDFSTLQVTQNEDGTYSGTLTRIEENLSQSRQGLSATSVGNYSMFYGGGEAGPTSTVADIYDLSLYLDDLFKIHKLTNIVTPMGIGIQDFKDKYDFKDSPSISMNDYRKMKSNSEALVQAKLDTQEWEGVSNRITEVTLEKERNALMTEAFKRLGLNAYTSDIVTSRDLYQYLLIDVETSGNTLISKLKLALNSLQLYVNRAIMGLEPNIISTIDDEVWSWMSSYRLWQANRKVFLYPENYFDPSLRKDASPEYQNFVRSISQGEINADNVNKAYSSYFHEFETLFRLEIVDYCTEYPSNTNDVTDNTLYVVARTKAEPYQYYQRQAILDNVGNVIIWNPWVKIDAHINSPKVSVTYAFNRWFLFWVENEDRSSTGTIYQNTKQISSYATIKYIFDHVNNGWSAPQTLQKDLLFAVNDANIKLGTVDSNILKTYNDDPTNPIWKTVSVNYVERANPNSDETQEIIISFGPTIQLDEVKKDVSVTNPAANSTAKSKELTELDTNLKQAFNTIKQEYSEDNLKDTDNTRLYSYVLEDDFSVQNGNYLTIRSETSLIEVRDDLAATSVGNYALFGGGYRLNAEGTNVYLKTVDIFDLSKFDGSQKSINKSKIELSNERGELAATSVGNYAIFGGGGSNLQYSNRVDVFDISTLEITDQDNATCNHVKLELSDARSNLAATSVGNYAIFGGGGSNLQYSNRVDVFDISTLEIIDQDNNATCNHARLELSDARNLLAATSVGNYAIFGGGEYKAVGATDITYSKVVDVFDISTLDILNATSSSIEPLRIELSNERSKLSATSAGNYAIFGGGYGPIVEGENTANSKSVDIFDFSILKTLDTTGMDAAQIKAAQEEVLQKSLVTIKLSHASDRLAAASIGTYIIFGGGIHLAGKDQAVDIFDLSKFDGTESTKQALQDSRVTLLLSYARGDLAATSVGNNIIFGGGGDGANTFSQAVDIFDISLLEGNKASLSDEVICDTVSGSSLNALTKTYFAQGADGLFNLRNSKPEVFKDLGDNIVVNNAINQFENHLTQSSKDLAATNIGNYALFGGGENAGEYSDLVDIFDLSQFDGRTESVNKSKLTLDQARTRLSATSVGNYAIFGGGYGPENSVNVCSDKVDIYDFSDPSNIRHITDNKLSEAREFLSSTSVGNYALFGGGENAGEYSDLVDIFDLSKLGEENSIDPVTAELPLARTLLAATSVGNYTIFGGGYGPENGVNVYSDKVDIFDFSVLATIDTTLSPTNTPAIIKANQEAALNNSIITVNLSERRQSLSATSVGNYAIFGGGWNGTNNLKTIDIFDLSVLSTVDTTPSSINTPAIIKANQKAVLTQSLVTIELSHARDRLAVASIGNYIIFGGGIHLGGEDKVVDIFDLSGFDGTDATKQALQDSMVTVKLSQARGDLAAASVGNYVLFGGGDFESSVSNRVDIFDATSFNQEKYVFCDYYRLYFWEIFFHIPLFIAEKLNQNKRFEEAKSWYEYIFNPIIHGNNSEYWNFLPFIDDNIQKLKNQLTDRNAINLYQEHPFDPEIIARLRPGAFDKFVVMKYVDNLINWADSLFTQYSWENIAHARMLYVMAYDLLGHKPKDVGELDPKRASETLQQILDTDGNKPIPDFLIHLAKLEPQDPDYLNHNFVNMPSIFNSLSAVTYFGIPVNKQLVDHWSTIEDRLYKIRNSENINGMHQQLPLFQPPIDPNQLVRSAAQSSLYPGSGSARQVTEPDPTILLGRFKVAIGQAHNITETVIQFGNAIESAYEKKDAEALRILEENQSQTILNLVTKVKTQEIEQAQNNIDALTENLASANYRFNHYNNLLSGGLSVLENNDLNLSVQATNQQKGSADLRVAATFAHVIPTVYGFADGCFQPGSVLDSAAAARDSGAAVINSTAATVSKNASYERRTEDWQLAMNTAKYEKEQIQKQIDANNVALSMAKDNLAIHTKQIEQAQDKLNFLKSKFTNEQLYEWIYGQLLTIYNTAYNLAFSTYLSAIRSYEFELNEVYNNTASSMFFESRKGLLSGEFLKLAINQLEQDYYNKCNNKYEHREIEKTISLEELLADYNSDPTISFEAGKAKGMWKFSLPKALFDDDFSNHTCRRIKTISVSFPAVIGPYQNIAATLEQTSYPEIAGLKSFNGYDNWISTKQVALSRNIDDNGMFQLDFHSDKYLPFEGTGAISNWELTINNAKTDTKPNGKIDLTNLSDIIIKVLYTSEEKDG